MLQSIFPFVTPRGEPRASAALLESHTLRTAAVLLALWLALAVHPETRGARRRR